MCCRLSTTMTVGKWLDSDARSPFILCTTWEIYCCMSPMFLALATNVTISSSLMSLPRHLKYTKNGERWMKEMVCLFCKWQDGPDRLFLTLLAANTKNTTICCLFNTSAACSKPAADCHTVTICTLCSKKSDAKIQITITMAYLIRIKYPFSGFNYHLSDVNVANFNKIHRIVSEQQLF